MVSFKKQEKHVKRVIIYQDPNHFTKNGIFKNNCLGSVEHNAKH